MVRVNLDPPRSLHSSSLEDAWSASAFLSKHVYGRSRVLPLASLLERQLRSEPPLPFRRDSLLITQPQWFELQFQRLGRLLHLRWHQHRV